MSLSSGVFLLFTAVTALVYHLVPGALRIPVLTISSVLFLLWTDTTALIAVCLVCLTAYIGGIIAGKVPAVSTVLTVLLMLPLLLIRLGRGGSILDPAPLGLSFYTLSAAAYIIDCKKAAGLPDGPGPEKNPLRLFAFLGFFPIVTSGPIERTDSLLPQLRDIPGKKRDEIISLRAFMDGCILIIWGFFLKLVIADRLGILVDNVYSGADHYGRSVLLTGALGFSLQLYADFCGYSSIAVGTGALFGLKLTDNFAAPYLASSPSEFWSRWHISLSRWLRDYIYIPLGGNRKGILRRYLNILITFAVSGLWHGTGLSFLAWGILHGIYQICADASGRILHRLNASKDTPYRKTDKTSISGIITTFLAVSFAWIFFRAESLSRALVFIKRMVTVPDLWVIPSGGLYSLGISAGGFFILAVSLFILLCADIVNLRTGKRIDRWLSEKSPAARLIFTLFILFLTLYFGVYGPMVEHDAAFLYGQF